MYGIQETILICGSGTFFLLETVFIAQSQIFALLPISSHCSTPSPVRSEWRV